MISIFCFKWNYTAGRRIPSQDVVKYGAEHVNKLYWMIYRNTDVPFRFACITDERDPNIYTAVKQIDLWDEFKDLGGCYPRLKIWDDSMETAEILDVRDRDRMLFIDLDVVITGNIDHVLNREEDFVYYRMPGPDGTGSRFNCGLYMLRYGTRPHIYHRFKQNPRFWINLAKNTTPGSDQAWCNYALDLKNEAYYDRDNDGIYDMRQDFIEKGGTDLDEHVRMVMWPGPRDPSEEKWRDQFKWIDEYWRES